MSLVLGLDSGGTKTVLAFADRNGQIVSLRRSRGLDPSVDKNWAAALQKMLSQDALTMQQVDAAVLGLPFHDEVAAYTAAQKATAQALIPGKSLVQNDVRVAFDGALAGRPGVLILAGTGSMAWASRNGPGDPHVRVGGWGDAIGDEGSAFWIGHKALAAVSCSLDGRTPAPVLEDGILSALGLRASDLMGWCYGLKNRRAGFASLAVAVSALADSGCPEAVAILHGAGDHLATHIKSAWQQTNPQGPLCWSYAGGVFSSQIVLRRVAEKLRRAPVPPRLPPVGGAILRAALRAGWAIDKAWVDRLAAALAVI
ncbi:MAG: BadF/BadG/BcrA/BcrD ATPase family protein [Paracoccaceae bacterium]|nr:BadF/BadG/BcrA/BcrD ATPase family protein [Paracoccaceae bacterium]